jgi:hypothetical protein
MRYKQARRLKNRYEVWRQLVRAAVFGRQDTFLTAETAVANVESVLPLLKKMQRTLHTYPMLTSDRRERQRQLRVKRRYPVLYQPDLRTGWELYGYESEEDIIYTLSYISDRWNCDTRINWLVDLPSGYARLKHTKTAD